MRRMLSTAAAAAAVCMASLPAAATAAWSRPVQATPRTHGVLGGELTNSGVLRLWWEKPSSGDLATGGVSLVTHTGRTHAVRRTAIERFVPSSDFDREPGEYQTPVYLADGRALRCMVSGPQWGHEARTYLLIYSPSGALVKKLLVADQSETYSDVADQVVAPTCEVTAAGEQAAVMFTQNTATTYQPARQIYLARLLSGDRVSAPVAILGSSADEMTFLQARDAGDVSISPTGWVAVDWGYDDILKVPRGTLTQTWQWRMNWVSPAGTVGPTIAITPMQGGRPCPVTSGTCTEPWGGLVNVVGDEKALVMSAGSPYAESQLRSATVDAAGNVSRWTTVSSTGGSVLSFGAGGGTVVVIWGDQGARVHAVQWRNGAWSKPQVLASPKGGMGASYPSVSVNDRGQAAVWWAWSQLRQTLYPTEWTQAVFNF